MSIGPQGTDIQTTLYKKLFGVPNTLTGANISQEYTVNSLPFIVPSQIASQSIPTSGIPTTTAIDAGNTDTNFTITTISYTDNTSSGDTTYSSARKCIWNSNTYITYYSKILLSPLSTSSISFIYKNASSNILTRAILPTLSTDTNKYNITVERKSGSTWILVPASDYLFDRDAGVLTIYNSTLGINSSNPPRISFWRYEGTTNNEANEPSLGITQPNKIQDRKPVAIIDTNNTLQASGVAASITGGLQASYIRVIHGTQQVRNEMPNYSSFNNTLQTNILPGMITANKIYSVSSPGIAGASDRRLKANINKLSTDFCINFINKLNPVEFNYINDLLTTNYGLIAQEIEEIAKTYDKNLAVYSKRKLLNEDTTEEADETYFITYTELIAPMIKVIQELITNKKTLEERVTKLEKELEIIKAHLNI